MLHSPMGSAQTVDKLISRQRKGSENEEFPEFNPQDGLLEPEEYPDATIGSGFCRRQKF